MRISDWSSDVCSSDLPARRQETEDHESRVAHRIKHRIAAIAIGHRHLAIAIDDDGRILQYLPRALDPDGDRQCHPQRPLRHQDRKCTRLTPVTNAHLVCRLLLEKKKTPTKSTYQHHTHTHQHDQHSPHATYIHTNQPSLQIH